MKYSLCILLSIILNNRLFSQKPFFEDKGIRVNLFNGYHFAANNVYSTRESLNGYVTGIDIGLMKMGLDKEAFSSVYGKPRVGVDLRILKMNHTPTYGYSIGLLPSFELELLHYDNTSLQFKMAYGLNYNSRLYDTLKNFNNRSLSLPVNFAFDAGIQFHSWLSGQMELNVGIGLYHVSNGSLKMPNGGINISYLTTGISYFPHLWASQKYMRPNYVLFEKDIYYMGYISAAYREQGYFGYLRKFPVFSVVNQVMYRFNKLYSAGPGVDCFYDASPVLAGDYISKYEDIPENRKYYMAVGIANRFDIGKLFIPAGVYTYFYNNRYVKEPLYLRFGLGYKLGQHFFVGSFFKGTVNSKYKLESDFMEWSLGCQF